MISLRNTIFSKNAAANGQICNRGRKFIPSDDGVRLRESTPLYMFVLIPAAGANLGFAHDPLVACDQKGQARWLRKSQTFDRYRNA